MAVCSQSSTCLKIAAVFVIIALALHITGFATTSWSTVETELELIGYDFKVTISYLVGLWKHCVCVDVLGAERCTCEKFGSPPGWLEVTRGLAGLAIIGMIVGSILAITGIFQETFPKQLKIFNIIGIVGTGGILIISIIVYGIESKQHIDTLIEALEYIEDIDVYSFTKFGYSFVLPIISGCICLVVCVPLLICDLNTPPKQSNIAIAPILYDNQVQVISYPQGPSHGYPGNMQHSQTVMMQPNIYPAPPGNSMCMQQVPPPYASAPQEPVGIPPKS